jgi:hypothetical protein
VIEAVYTTFVPSQILLPVFEEIETVGVAVLFTVIVILLPEAIAGVAQTIEEVI